MHYKPIYKIMKRKLVTIKKEQFEDDYALNMFQSSFNGLRLEFINVLLYEMFDKYVFVCKEEIMDDVITVLAESSGIDFSYKHRFCNLLDISILERSDYSSCFS